MRINVLRQACCSADDQANELQAVYEVDSKATMETLLLTICESDFLQYSSTNDRLSVEIDDRQVAEVYPSSPPTWAANIGPKTPVKWLVGDRTLHFNFRLKNRHLDSPLIKKPSLNTKTNMTQPDRTTYAVISALIAFGGAWLALNTVLAPYYLESQEQWLISLLAAIAGYMAGRSISRSKTDL
ncbi:hypothetical protein [Herbaspirillum robiniae]|uniref:hypothetical protein n=1 Tax=Herbaspirillum robiniae TaxID=2014887 RepID=UPI00101AE368|nr:hypothetical protein [Herbaspirillum robiniae]